MKSEDNTLPQLPNSAFTPEFNALFVNALLGLVADIRTAVGDPTGKLMQDELVARCRHLKQLEEKAGK